MFIEGHPIVSYCCCSCFFCSSHVVAQVDQCSRKNHGKRVPNCHVYGCKALREFPQVRPRTYCTTVFVLRGGVSVALWLESWPARLEHLPVAGLFPRL